MATKKKKLSRNAGSSPATARNGARNAASMRSRNQGNGRKRNGTKGQGSPKASFDRYIALAQSAAANGDDVEAEGHYQHAEHFYRVMNESVR